MIREVHERRTGHQEEAVADLLADADAAREPVREQRAGEDARDRRDEEPAELARGQVQVLEDERRRGRDVDEQPDEVERDGPRVRVEAQCPEHELVALPQRMRVEGLAQRNGERLRQQAPARPQQQRRVGEQHEEDRSPVERLDDPAAEDRSDRGGDREDHRHEREQLLGFGSGIEVADHRATDDDAGAGRDALEDAEGPEVLDRVRRRASERRDHEDAERHEDHVATTKRVGQRAMPQDHHREREHVRRHRLLYLDRRRIERRRDLRERGQIGVDRERAEHRERRQHDGETRARGDCDRVRPRRDVGGAHGRGIRGRSIRGFGAVALRADRGAVERARVHRGRTDHAADGIGGRGVGVVVVTG